MIKKKYPPGLHGLKRTGRISGYGIQFREKQKAKRIYQILEKQFKNYFKKAQKLKKDTGQNLLRLLELRLDNVLYRSGLFSSRSASRQIVNHGHILINGRKVNIPSYQVKKGQIITFKQKIVKYLEEKLKTNNPLTPLVKGEYKGELEIPKWLFFDEKKLELKIAEEPAKENLPQDINTKLIVEIYSR